MLFLASGENGGKRNFFSKLKRSATSPSVPAHPESSAKNLLFGRHLQDDTTLPKPITVCHCIVLMYYYLLNDLMIMIHMIFLSKNK